MLTWTWGGEGGGGGCIVVVPVVVVSKMITYVFLTGLKIENEGVVCDCECRDVFTTLRSIYISILIVTVIKQINETEKNK